VCRTRKRVVAKAASISNDDEVVGAERATLLSQIVDALPKQAIHRPVSIIAKASRPHAHANNLALCCGALRPQ